MKKKMLSILQLALGIGLIFVLFHHMDKQDLFAALHDIAENWLYFAGAIICFLGCIILATMRWQIILATHGINISFLRAINFYFIGQFFNAFMLGAVGGDLVKALVASREFPEKRAVAVSSIFIDRIIGMLALVLLSVAITIIFYKFFLLYPETRVIMFFLITVTLGTSVAMYAAFRRSLLQNPAIAKLLAKHKKIGDTVTRVYNAFQDCLTHRGLMTRTILLSLGGHIALIGAAFMIGLGLNITTISPVPKVHQEKISDTTPISSHHKILLEFTHYITIFPIIDGIASIPATPGGLGTREYASKVMMEHFEVPETRSVPLSLLLYLTSIFWSLVGGIFYAVYVIRSGERHLTGKPNTNTIYREP